MATPTWLERLRNLSQGTKKRIIVAFLAVAVVAVIVPMIIMQARLIGRQAVESPEIASLKENIGNSIDQAHEQQAEFQRQTDTLLSKLSQEEQASIPLKSALDHNVTAGILATSSIAGQAASTDQTANVGQAQTAVIDLTIFNFNDTPVSFDPSTFRLIQGERSYAPSPSTAWPADLLNDHSPLGSTVAKQTNISGTLLFEIDPAKPFDLDMPGFVMAGTKETWGYHFSQVSLQK